MDVSFLQIQLQLKKIIIFTALIFNKMVFWFHI